MPWQFWRCTIKELNTKREEWRREQRRILEREAHWVACILRALGQKNVRSATDLIGFSPEQIIQVRKEMAEKRARLAKQKEKETAHGQDHR